jgi:hypothetical protein
MQSSKITSDKINQIAVEEVTLFGDNVTIAYYLPEWDEAKELVIDAYKYEKHLKEILALDWSFKVMEGNVYKDDVEGTMSLAEYFADVDFQQHNKDAVSYLRIYHVEHEPMHDITKGIVDICKAFVKEMQICNPDVFGQDLPQAEKDVINQSNAI